MYFHLFVYPIIIFSNGIAWVGSSSIRAEMFCQHVRYRNVVEYDLTFLLHHTVCEVQDLQCRIHWEQQRKTLGLGPCSQKHDIIHIFSSTTMVSDWYDWDIQEASLSSSSLLSAKSSWSKTFLKTCQYFFTSSMRAPSCEKKNNSPDLLFVSNSMNEKLVFATDC